MRRSPETGPCEGVPWSLVCLLLVAMLCGHDLLMALAADSAFAADAKTAPHGLGTRTLERDEAAHQTHSPEPGHPDDCGVARPAIPRISDELDTVAQAVATTHWFLAADVAPAVADDGGWWVEPRWPPGALRAFLGVYRI